uniref:U53-Theraphotoxin-Sfo1a_1 n=1 Tax=Selenotholus foelschei TaxID=1905327 RepID=A0A482ZAM0_9ARAC
MGFLALIFLTLLVGTFSQECGTRTCGEGQCCRVSFFIFNRCSPLAGVGQRCNTRRNTSNMYYWHCPCQAGLECRGFLFPRCRRPRITTSTTERNSTTPLTTSSSEGTSVITEETPTDQSISTTSSSNVVITTTVPPTTTDETTTSL